MPLAEDGKLTRLDVRCDLSSGEQVDVEVQVLNLKNMRRRTLYYWAQIYPFHYEDFPPEPLPLDGSLNHGIEHALSFIAQAAGYETRTLLSRRGAEVRCTLQERLLKRLCGFLAGRYYYATVEGLMQEMEGQTLMHFCERFPRRYIYGAGYHGRRLLPILAQMGFAAAGFLVSDGYDLPVDLPLPVQHVSELARAADAGVIVAAAAGTRPAMMRALRALGWQEAQCYALR